MRLVIDWLGAVIVGQLALLILWYVANDVIHAVFELYVYSGGVLFWFHFFGIAACLYLLNSVVRVFVLRSSIGSRAERAARTKGYRP